MKNNIALFALLLASSAAHGMNTPHPLNNIEKAIFLQEVTRIGGKEAALEKIRNTEEPKPISRGEKCGVECSPCFVIGYQCNPQSENQLSQRIMQEINNAEQKHTCFKIAKNGHLGHYTRYWHTVGHDGPFIRLQSIFYDKEALLDVLNNQ